jgi:hypothetical protein
MSSNCSRYIRICKGDLSVRKMLPFIPKIAFSLVSITLLRIHKLERNNVASFSNSIIKFSDEEIREILFYSSLISDANFMLSSPIFLQMM